jgi:hypothetical protein
MRNQQNSPRFRYLSFIAGIGLLGSSFAATGCSDSQAEIILILGNIPQDATNIQALVRINPTNGSPEPIQQIEPSERWTIGDYKDNYKIGLKIPASSLYDATIAIGVFKKDCLLTTQLIPAPDLSVGRHELAGGLPSLLDPPPPCPTNRPYIHGVDFTPPGDKGTLTIHGWGFRPDNLTSVVRLASPSDSVPPSTGTPAASPDPLTITTDVLLTDKPPVVTYYIGIQNQHDLHRDETIRSFSTAPQPDPLSQLKITRENAAAAHIITDYTVTDINNDGYPDVIVAQFDPAAKNSGSISIYKNINGTELQESQIFQFPGVSYSVIAGKFTQGNTGTAQDIAVAVRPPSGAGTIYILKQSNGTFMQAQQLATPPKFDTNRSSTYSPFKIISATLNNDEYPDLVGISNPSPRPLDPTADKYMGALMFWENTAGTFTSKDVCTFEVSAPLTLNKARVSNTVIDDIIVGSTDNNVVNITENSVNIFPAKALGSWPTRWHFYFFPDNAVIRKGITGRPSALLFATIGNAATDKYAMLVPTPYFRNNYNPYGIYSEVSLLSLSSNTSWANLAASSIVTTKMPFDVVLAADRNTAGNSIALVTSLSESISNFSAVNYFYNDGKSIKLDVMQQRSIKTNGINRVASIDFTKDGIEDTLVVSSGIADNGTVTSRGTISVKIEK